VLAHLAGRIPVFDLDGTLLDSDPAIVAAFAAIGVGAHEIRFGPLLEVECARLGVRPEDYLAAYDGSLAVPYPGADAVVAALADRTWAVCSNKEGIGGRAALERAGWTPTVAAFADRFDGRGKTLRPVLDELGVGADAIVYVGDTVHDAACAAEVGCPFVVAGWNPRAAALRGDAVAHDLLDLLALVR
jgi:HAD superfamily hydrolase (TIGR01549 family)